MSLDNRLIDILQHTTQAKSIPLQVAQIKQAFADEGYIQPKVLTADTNLNQSVYREIKEAGYMTGQEWYDRFAKELPIQLIEDYHFIPMVTIVEAARKAAGL